MKRLTVKSTKEMLEVLEETRETYQRPQNRLPYSQWEHKRTQIKEEWEIKKMRVLIKERFYHVGGSIYSESCKQ